jgi:hypothetical protein
MEVAQMSWHGVVVAAAIGWYAAPAMGQNSSPSLICAVYGTQDGALTALDDLRQFDREQMQSIRSYVVVYRDDIGLLHWVRTDGRDGSMAVSVVEGLDGRSPAGVSRDDLETFKRSLTPGRSALVATLEDDWAIDLARSLHHSTDARRVMRRKIGSQ